jgi:outer membrane protein
MPPMYPRLRAPAMERTQRYCDARASRATRNFDKSVLAAAAGVGHTRSMKLFLFAACGFALAAPARAQGDSPAVLSMEQAIEKTIETNLAAHLARASSVEARGKVVQAVSSLLPQLLGSVSQDRVFKTNLAVAGFTSNPLIPDPVIGPFNVFDARLRLTQKLLDANAVWLAKEASANARAARLGEDLAAEQVASAAALAYIEDLRALRQVQDARTNWELARRLSEQAHRRRDAGLATAVDLARADTRVAVDHQTLIQAELSAYLSDLRLKRIAGLPLSAGISLTGSLDAAPGDAPEEAPALAAAGADRFELKVTRERLIAEAYGLSSARAGYLPTVTARGDYGFSGNTPDSTARTGSVGASLEFPIFSGGQTYGQIKERKGRRSAAQSQDDDAKIQVEEDVRAALRAFSAEKDDVDAAETRKLLAERELDLAQNRYGAGAGDNIQVVTAQASLADALKSRSDALARFAAARVNLAAALGRARTFHL